MIGIPTMFDQEINLVRVEKLGAASGCGCATARAKR